MDDTDVFESVAWESHSPAAHEPSNSSNDGGYYVGPGFRARDDSQIDPRNPSGGPSDIKWEGHLNITVSDPVKELDGTKDMYVSYKVTAQTDLASFPHKMTSTRRRFQDFTFLREHLSKDFPAAVVPPLPGKHRLEYVTGDRFSTDFIDRRKLDLQRFMDRLSRHPTLQRAKLLRDFLESTEWSVQMHAHLAHPPVPDSGGGTLLENLSDTLINAFSRVRKPDERFLEMRDGVDKFEEGLVGIERGWNRVHNKTGDISNDYHDLAIAVQALGFLESGITDPLNRFSNVLLEFSTLLKANVRTPELNYQPLLSPSHMTTLPMALPLSPTGTSSSTTQTDAPFVHNAHSLLAYSQANRAVLRLRDQKQLDFEELSEYMTQVSLERDRLAARAGLGGGVAPATGLGIGAYIRDRVEAIRGNVDDDRSRVDKMKKLDAKIKELKTEVTSASDTLEAFSEETLKEQKIFEHAKRTEMKEILGELVDGQIELYEQAMKEWDSIIPVMQRIRVDV